MLFLWPRNETTIKALIINRTPGLEPKIGACQRVRLSANQSAITFYNEAIRWAMSRARILNNSSPLLSFAA
jgi:hypothetical protein